MPYQVTLIPGDGIGPEVSGAARQVLDATGVGIEWGAEGLRPAGCLRRADGVRHRRLRLRRNETWHSV